MPDPANPYVFKLWKAKGAERLVYHPRTSLDIAVDGTPLLIDLLTSRQVVSGGHLELRFVRDPQQIVRNQRHGFAWRLEISAPGGGLRWREDHFGFEAPEGGYQQSLVIGQAVDDPEWRDVAEREFCLRTAQGYHGRIQFKLCMDSQPPPGILYFTVFLNPTGSRNLEFNSQMVYETVNISANGVFQPAAPTPPVASPPRPPPLLPPPDRGPDDLIKSFPPNTPFPRPFPQ